MNPIKTMAPIDEICKSLGVPQRVFQGEQYSQAATWEAYDEQRRALLRDYWGKYVLLPWLNKCMPEECYQYVYRRGVIIRELRVMPEITWIP